MLQSSLKAIDFPKQISDIQMRTCLFPSLINQLTVLPVELMAEKDMHPIVDGVLDVLEETEIILSDDVTVVIIIADTFGNHQLIPVLIVGKHEDLEKSYDDWKQTTSVGEHLVKLPHLSFYVDEFSIHRNVD